MRGLLKFGLAIGLALSLGACVHAPKARSACYWMTQDGSRWQAWPDAKTKQMCFTLDSCNGGQAASGGGCYKWATGADKPGEKW